MEKLKKVTNNFLTREVILYIVFGIFTTIVNMGSFYLMNSILKLDDNLSNFIAILLAVLFAYVTNKDLVFHSKAKSNDEKLYEFLKFIAGRAFTMLIEFIGGALLFRTIIPKIISKASVTVLVVVLNFFISKFFAFKNNN